MKTKIAAAHLANLMQVKVDTDRDGVVWLSGTAQSREVADQAVQIAKTTDGVIQRQESNRRDTRREVALAKAGGLASMPAHPSRLRESSR